MKNGKAPSGRHHANWIDAYLVFTKDLEAPEIFHRAVAYWTIASAVRRRVWINQGHFDYVPNQYFVLVAPPGIVAKSTTISIGKNLLTEIPSVTFGPDSTTWQAMFDALVRSQREEVFGDPSDLNATRQISAPLTLAISEFGTFLNMDEDQLVNLLINYWDGTPGIFNRTTRKDGPINITNPLINLIGCTTDAWMLQNFKAHLLEGGLGSRTLFIHQSKKRKLVAYPHLNYDPEQSQLLQHNLVQDLETIANLYGEMVLSPEALEWGGQFYIRHYTEAPKAVYFDGYHARKFVHLHKLGMLNSLAESGDLIIRKHHLITALSFLETVEEGLAKTTALVRNAGSTQNQRVGILRSFLRARTSTSERELAKYLLTTMNSRDSNQVIDDLIRAGEISRTQGKGGLRYTWTGDESEGGETSS